MVNSEIYGGLLTALQRGSSWYDAMMSLYNAGYPKEEIEETAGILKNHLTGKIVHKSPEPQKEVEKKIIPPSPVLKPAFGQRPVVNLKPVANIQSVPVPSRMPAPVQTPQRMVPAPANTPAFRQTVSSYAITPKKEIPVQSPPKIIPLSQPITQKVSSYPAPSFEKKSKISLVVLFILLIILLGALAGLFLFRDKIFEFLGSLSF
jgi:hypothetical protein